MSSSPTTNIDFLKQTIQRHKKPAIVSACGSSTQETETPVSTQSVYSMKLGMEKRGDETMIKGSIQQKEITIIKVHLFVYLCRIL